MDFAGVLFERQRAVLARLLLGEGRDGADGGDFAAYGRKASAGRRNAARREAPESDAVRDGLPEEPAAQDRLGDQGRGEIREIGTGFRNRRTEFPETADSAGTVHFTEAAGASPDREAGAPAVRPPEALRPASADFRRGARTSDSREQGQGPGNRTQKPDEASPPDRTRNAQAAGEAWEKAETLREQGGEPADHAEPSAETARLERSPSRDMPAGPVQKSARQTAELEPAGFQAGRESGSPPAGILQSVPGALPVYASGGAGAGAAFFGEDASSWNPLPAAAGTAMDSGSSAQSLSKIFQRDARRYDGGFVLF